MRQRLWAAILVGQALVGACGGESSRREAGRENPMSGSGGAAGTAGSTCPATAPRAAGSACPDQLPSEGCTYELDCQSGPRTFTYRCDGLAQWWVDAGTCDLPYDFCSGGDAQVRCRGEDWQLTGGGGDQAQDCAVERPVPGSECSWSVFSAPSTCGYRCPDGTGWTVASCALATSPTVWLLDGACPGDCSAHERALLDYATMHRRCETDADCRYLESSCAFTRAHCSGAFAVGPSVDPAAFERLDEALETCASEPDSGWLCGGCDAEPAAVRCVNETCTVGE